MISMKEVRKDVRWAVDQLCREKGLRFVPDSTQSSIMRAIMWDHPARSRRDFSSPTTEVSDHAVSASQMGEVRESGIYEFGPRKRRM